VSVLINQRRAVLSAVIDIRPGSDVNSVPPNSHGVVQVLLLGGEEFDVGKVDPATLQFGPGWAEPLPDPGSTAAGGDQRPDRNGDGFADLFLRFRISETGIVCGDEGATLKGYLRDGTLLVGSDSVVTRGCPPARWQHRVH
jgi:hypothetical protein